MKKLLFILFISGFLACSKSQVSYDPERDITKPIMKIEYPLDVPVLPRGYPLCMKVLIKDNQSLSTVWLEINDGNGYRKDYLPITRSMEIVEKYFAPQGISGEFLARFFAMDEAGNTSIAEIRFVMNN